MNNDIINEIAEAVRIYKKTKEVKAVCTQMRVSTTKARKLLVSGNIKFENRHPQSQIDKLVKDGKTVDEIVKETRLSRQCVNSYLPYTKCAYDYNDENIFEDDTNRNRIKQIRIKKSNPIKYYRIKKGITQKELADKIETTQSVIARWETGNIKPSIENYTKLSIALGVKIDDII